MEAVNLDVTMRTGTGKGPNRRLRAEGLVPGVVYGSGGENLVVAFKPTPLVALLATAYGHNTLMRLSVDGKPGPVVILREYQVHPVRRTLTHVDFFRVDANKPIVVEVPLEVVGKSEAEKAGGKRRVVTPNIRVSCVPSKIPQTIQYDVSPIEKTTVVYISDLAMPEGVTAVFRRPFPVLSITAAKG
jgi:large subunit ribosomal protein L25